jgi:hypothetical protein
VVEIADSAEEFVAGCERALAGSDAKQRAATDALLARQSWDRTWSEMDACIRDASAAGAINLYVGSGAE